MFHTMAHNPHKIPYIDTYSSPVFIGNYYTINITHQINCSTYYNMITQFVVVAVDAWQQRKTIASRSQSISDGWNICCFLLLFVSFMVCIKPNRSHHHIHRTRGWEYVFFSFGFWRMPIRLCSSTRCTRLYWKEYKFLRLLLRTRFRYAGSKMHVQRIF